MIGNDNERFEISDEDEALRVPWSCMSGKGCFCKMKQNAANRSQFPGLWSVFRREGAPVGFGVLARLDDY